jgi:hypothetical protein
MYEPDAMPQRCKHNPSFHLDVDFDSAKHAGRHSAMHMPPREQMMAVTVAASVLNALATEASVS